MAVSRRMEAKTTGTLMDIEKERRLTTEKFKALRKKEHVPAQLLDILEQVAAMQLDAREQLHQPEPDLKELAEPVRRNQGAPILPREMFRLDTAGAAALFNDLLELACNAEPPLSNAAQTIREAIEAERLAPLDAIEAYVAQDIDFFSKWEPELGEAPRTLSFLAQAAATPSAVALGEILSKELDTTRTWMHGHCPVCGSLPLIAELRDREGHKHCICSFCRSDYRVPRLACLFCGETAQDKLTFITAEEEPGFRLDLCHSCKTYLKTLDFRQLDRRSLPLLDDLDSLALDILAAKDQWRRATFSGWGF
ncbi:formate dehydrogenase accessory protein FdhE [Oceanidesulfovibrio indonesiensis]|uniref:Formate dehydrogenase accessory protein FdhE n=2 Tax=Oceanidesulfovibrio indonesiensis TaxID=54767 RepID=A0A7M3MF52_9BACT|nr:formate dehydrogenase accessory protein FdhE [Oceanidesulfovibrio indonesiensis]